MTWPAHLYNPEYTLPMLCQWPKIQQLRIEVRAHTKDLQHDTGSRLPSHTTRINLSLSSHLSWVSESMVQHSEVSPFVEQGTSSWQITDLLWSFGTWGELKLIEVIYLNVMILAPLTPVVGIIRTDWFTVLILIGIEVANGEVLATSGTLMYALEDAWLNRST